DMYDPANGYRPMAEGPSRYAAGFLAEFRAAQRVRCERLDRLALEWCEEAAYFRAKLGAAEPAERPRLARYALQRRYLLVYRTLADPRYLDPTLDPSERPLATIFSFVRDPVVGNYGDGLAGAMAASGRPPLPSGRSHASRSATTCSAAGPSRRTSVTSSASASARSASRARSSTPTGPRAPSGCCVHRASGSRTSAPTGASAPSG